MSAISALKSRGRRKAWAAQDTKESAQHIPQQPQPESVTPCDDCEYYDRCSERPFNKARGCRLRYAE
jgi:hypothetical protein